MAFPWSPGIALPLLKRGFAIAPAMVGFIGSALVLGAVLGAAVGGMAADRIGRKRAFLVDMAILAVGSVLCVIALGGEPLWLQIKAQLGSIQHSFGCGPVIICPGRSSLDSRARHLGWMHHERRRSRYQPMRSAARSRLHRHRRFGQPARPFALLEKIQTVSRQEIQKGSLLLASTLMP
jgi:hypothetical protein